ncbi:polyprenyl synthetase family protein [Georgenia yuyongxinii]|uniref:polyprenyl synthetase family protein n=1 Tax=Georgenia yuyongxinii TaxID=2589797 RepID=UPI003634E25E
MCGGKRFRARIVTRAHAGLGGTRDEAAVQVAAAFELLHSGFLVHDDLIDHDTMRRGEPNLSAAMFRFATEAGADADGAARFSEASAILAGDLLLGMAHELFAGLDVPPAEHARLRGVLAETLFVSVAGELDDVASGLGLGVTTMEQAMEVAQSKTAMYSFQAPLGAAGILAGAAPEVMAELDALGLCLGRAFQLVDDLLGTFAPVDVTGKSNISDLREGKVTALILHARATPAWKAVREHLGRPDLDEVTARKLRRALAASDAPTRVAAQVREQLAGVERALVGTALPSTVVTLVDEIAGMIAATLADAERHVLTMSEDGCHPAPGGGSPHGQVDLG